MAIGLILADIAAWSIIIAGLAMISLQYQAIDIYMDEIFHIPQAQRYCICDFSHWDSKITTFPGLYLLSAGALRALRSILLFTGKTLDVDVGVDGIGGLVRMGGVVGMQGSGGIGGMGVKTLGLDGTLGAEVINSINLVCSVSMLRNVNVLLAALSPIVYAACRRKIAPSSRDGPWTAAFLFLYPISFFYYFLYYTDTASTLSIVVTYHLALCQVEQVAQEDPTDNRVTDNRVKVDNRVTVNKRATSDDTVTDDTVTDDTVTDDTVTDDDIVTDNTVTGFAGGGQNRGGRGGGSRFVSQVALLIAGSASILIRQTNAVWLLFIAGTAMISLLEKRRAFSDSRTATLHKLLEFILQLVANVPYLLLGTWPLLIPVIAFLAFVVVNKGIVVGDKEHHVPVYHLAMPLHFCVTYAVLLVPSDIMSFIKSRQMAMEETNGLTRANANTTNATNTPNTTDANATDKANKRHANATYATNTITSTTKYNSMIKYYFHVLGFLGVTYVLLHCTLSHPFLLSDNRHYSFYLWRRVLSKADYRLFLAPLYYACAVRTLNRLVTDRGFIWTIVFATAVTITLVPAHLMEFRYFTPAIVIAVINSPPHPIRPTPKLMSCFANDGPISLLILVCCAINFLTIYVFMYKPFVWGDGTLARFMY